jgi:hypothetical protein
VERIEITDTWGGLGAPKNARYVITREGAGYVRRGTVDTGNSVMARPKPSHRVEGPTHVDAATVMRLDRAWAAAPLDREAGFARLMDPATLRRQAEAQYARLLDGGPDCSKQAHELFTSALLDPGALRASLDAMYDAQWTDDFPHVEVVVVHADGTRRTASSFGQIQFMLPWRTPAGETWNPELGASLAALLPGDAPNRHRLGGEDLLQELASTTKSRLGDRWDDLEGRCRYRDLLERLAQLGYATVAVPYAGYDAMNVTLRRADFPANLVVYAVFFDEARASELALFGRRIDAYADRAVAHARAHPEHEFKLEFYRTQSMTDVDEMMLDDTVKLRPGEAGKVVILRQADVRMSPPTWALLPDGRVEHWE